MLSLKTGGGGQSLHGQRLINLFSSLFKARKYNIPPILEEEMLQQCSPSSKGKKKEGSTPGPCPSSISDTLHGSREKSNSSDLSLAFVSSLPINARKEYGARRLEAARMSLRTFFGALRFYSNRYNINSVEKCDPSEIYREKDDDVCFLKLRRNTILAVELAALIIPPEVSTSQSCNQVYMKGDNSNTFGAMVLCAVQSFPEIRDRITLVELRAASHHLPRLWEGIRDDYTECNYNDCCVAQEIYNVVDDCRPDPCRSKKIGKGKCCSSSENFEDEHFVWFSRADGLRITKLKCMQKAICLQLLELYACASCQACGIECRCHHSDSSFRRSNPTTPADVTTNSNFYFCATILTDMCLLYSGVSPLTLEDQLIPHFSWCWFNDEEEVGEMLDVEQDDDWDGNSAASAEVSFTNDDEAERCSSSPSRNSEWEEETGSVHMTFSEDVNVQTPCGKLWNEENPPDLNVPSSWCSSEATVRKLMMYLRNPAKAPKYIKKVLWPVYYLIPERSHLKARFAFTLGLLASHADCEGAADVAEGVFLECVMVLNWLGEEEGDAFDLRSDPSCYHPPNDLPLLTHFGVNVLEKLGDALTKNGKYEYGILALERSIDCYALVRQYEKKQHIKLVRKVAMLTLAHNDSERALQYHIQLLRGAQAENNVNEFVYLGLEISRMLLEQGEFSGAEQYLIVASQLLSGAKLDQVQLLSPHGDPTTGKDCSMASSRSSSSSLIASGYFPVPEYMPTATAAGHQSSGLHQGGGGSISSGGPVRNMASVDLKPSSFHTAHQGLPLKKPSSYFGGEYVSCNSRFYNADSMESREGGGGAMDTQQFSLQMKLVDLYTVSQQYEKALRLLNGLLLNKSIPGNHRGKVLLEVARCYLKTNRVAACGAALDRIVYEVDESLGGFVDLLPSSNPSFVSHTETSPAARSVEWDSNIELPALIRSCSHNREWDKFASATMASSLAMTVKSVEFLSLCSKCRLAAGDPASALNWIKIAIANCVHSRTEAKRGKLFYIKARCHVALSAMAKERIERDDCSSSTTSSLFPKQSPVSVTDMPDDTEIEKIEMELALEAFDRSQSLFRNVNDVRRLGKCLASEAEMHLSRIFVDVTIHNINLKNTALGDGEAVLDMAEAKAGLALDISADVASPLTMIASLLNAAEVYLLRGRTVLAYKAWKEAQTILTLTYLQRQVTEEYLAEQQIDLDLESPSTSLHHSSTMGSLGKGDCAAAASSAAKRYKDTLHPFWKRRRTSWYYPALPSVPHPPCIMRRVHAILSRVIRLSFVLTELHRGTLNLPMPNTDSMSQTQSSEQWQSSKPSQSAISPSPLSTTLSVDPEADFSNSTNPKGISFIAGDILASSALPNSTHLLAGWLVLDALVHYPCHPPPLAVMHSGIRGGGQLHSLSSHASIRTSPHPQSSYKSNGNRWNVSSSAEVLQGPLQSTKPRFNSEVEVVASPDEPPPPPLDGNDNELVANGIKLSQQQQQPFPTNEEAHFQKETIGVSSPSSVVEARQPPNQLLNNDNNGGDCVHHDILNQHDDHLSIENCDMPPLTNKVILSRKNGNPKENIELSEMIHRMQQVNVDEEEDDDEGNNVEKAVVSLERCSDESKGKIVPVGIGVRDESSIVITEHQQQRDDDKAPSPPRHDDDKELKVSSKVHQSVKLDLVEDYSSSNSSNRLRLSSYDIWQGEQKRANTIGEVGTGSDVSYNSVSSSFMNSNDEHRAATEDSNKPFMKYCMKCQVQKSLPNSPHNTKSSLVNHVDIHSYGDEDASESGHRNTFRSHNIASSGVREGCGKMRASVNERRRRNYRISVSESLEAVYWTFKYTNSSPSVVHAAARESARAFQHEQSGKSTPTMRIHHPNYKNTSSSTFVTENSLYTGTHAPLLWTSRMTGTGQLIDVSFEQQQPYLEQNGSYFVSSSTTQTNTSTSDSNPSTFALDSSVFFSSPSISMDRLSRTQGGGGETESPEGGSGESGVCVHCNGVSRIQYVKSKLEEEKAFVASHESTYYKGIKKRLNLHLHHKGSSTAGTIDPLLSKGCSGGGSGASNTTTNNHPISGSSMGQGRINHHHRKAETSHLTTLNSWLFHAGERRNNTPTEYLGGFDVNGGGGRLSRKSSSYNLHLGMRSSESSLWMAFCKMKQANKLYSCGNLSLSGLYSQNMQMMRKILFIGREIGRPIIRSDRSDLSDGHSKGDRNSNHQQGHQTGKRREGNGQQAITHNRKGINNRTGPPPRFNRNRTFDSTTTTSGLLVQQQQNIKKYAHIFCPPPTPPPYHSTVGSGGIKSSHMIIESPFGGGSSGRSTGTTRYFSPIRRPELSRYASDLSGRSFDSFVPTSSESGYSDLGQRIPTPQRRHSSSSASHILGLVDIRAGIPLRCRHTYPTAFAFIFFMDGAYFYYCPSSGKMNIKSVSRLCAPPVQHYGAKLRICPSLLHFRWVRGLDDLRARSAFYEGLPEVVNHQTQTSKGTTSGPSIDSSTTAELYDDVLNSISESQPNRCLPLVPEDDRDAYFLSKDNPICTVVDVLSPQFTLFLVTALLLEQPVLMVAKPGEENILAHVGAGLLRLLRPLQWQYTHISVCPFSSLSVLLHCINSKQPFLIGVHTSTLDYICLLKRGCGCCCHKGRGESIGSSNNNNSIGGERGSSTHHTSYNKTRPTFTDHMSVIDMNHVTIVDLDSGIVTPSIVLKYASATMLHQHFTPDADPVICDTLPGFPVKGVSEAAFEFLNFLKDYEGAQAGLSPLGYSIPGMLPPLPAKYRHQLSRNLNAAMSSLDDTVNIIEKGGGSGGAYTAAYSFGGDSGGKVSLPPCSNRYNSEEEKKTILNHRCAEVLRHGIFLILVTMLKPYHLFLDDGPWGPRISLGDGGSDGIGMPNMSNFDVEAFLSFVNDDARPFLRLLLNTKAFSVFIERSVRFHVPPYKENGPPSCLNFKAAHEPFFWKRFERKSSNQSEKMTTSLHTESPSRCCRESDECGATNQPEAEAQQPAASFSRSKESNNSLSSESESCVPKPTRIRRYREEFELSIRVRMRWKFEMFQDVTHERIAGVLLTRLAQEGQDVTRIPEKRRWCVLDAGRFSYYKSRLGRGRKQRRKGQVALDPRSVVLITPPFMILSGKETTEANSVALVSTTFPPEVACIIIRAESLKFHTKWVRALKARLTPKDTLNKMDRLYSS